MSTNDSTLPRALVRMCAPLLVLACALMATAFAAETLDSGTAAAAAVEDQGPPPIAVSLTLHTHRMLRVLGPELSGVAVEAGARSLSKYRPAADRWLCDRSREGRARGLVEGCPAGGVLLSGPDGKAICTVHAGATPRARPVADGATTAALAALERVKLTLFLDGETLRPDLGRGSAALTFARGSGAAERLGLGSTASGRASVELDAADGQRVRLALERARDAVAIAWTPASASPGSSTTAPAPSLLEEPPAAQSRDTVLAELSVPIGTPMWRIFEARMPGGVGLGRPPVALTVIVRPQTIEVRVRHDSQAGVLNLDANLATGLSVLKVATAFKRRSGVDHVFEYLFRAPRRMEGDELVIDGEWPPELKGGVVPALESAVEHGPAPLEVVRATCRVRRLRLESAAAAWEAERGAALAHARPLVDEGFLERVPDCPEGAVLTLDDGVARCPVHQP